MEAKPVNGKQAMLEIIADLEHQGAARLLPKAHQLQRSRRAVEAGDHRLRDWWERFGELDEDRRPLKWRSPTPPLNQQRPHRCWRLWALCLRGGVRGCSALPASKGPAVAHRDAPRPPGLERPQRPRAPLSWASLLSCRSSLQRVAAGRILTRSGRLDFDPPLEMAGMMPACWEDRK